MIFKIVDNRANLIGENDEENNLLIDIFKENISCEMLIEVY